MKALLQRENGMGFVTDVKVTANGRMVLPLAVRQALGITGEARLILAVEGDEVRLSPISHVVTRVRDLYREHATQDAGSDQFLRRRQDDDQRRGGDPD